MAQNKSTSPEKLSIFIGGGKINKNFIQQLISKGYPVYTSYGMTETASTFAINKIKDANNYNNSGKPLPGNEIKIIQGKLAIKTPNLYIGQLNEDHQIINPKLTGDFTSQMICR